MSSLFNRVFTFFISMRATAALLFIIAFACAIATFIENDYDARTARAVVYNHWWFEIALLLLSVSLVGNMMKLGAFSKKKAPILILHGSILIILAGAFLTRYFGYEGIMYIREGETSNSILSSEPYLKIASSGLKASKALSLSSIASANYSLNANLGGGAPVTLKTKAYYRNAKEIVAPLETGGKPYISVMINYGDRAPVTAELFYGEFVDLGGTIIAFGEHTNSEKPAIVVDLQNDQLVIRAYSDLMRVDTDANEQTVLRAHTAHPFEPNMPYKALDGAGVVLREHLLSAGRVVTEANPRERSGASAIIADVTHKGERKEVALFGGVGSSGVPVDVELAGRNFTLSFGSEEIELPFSLKLDRFIIERYPGSSMPSSYESRVTLIDADRNINEPKRIYMNNILTHKQFRFYQSSYDRDERGTILSVSNDPGAWLTYIGYAALSIGFLIAFFSPNSRFRTLVAQIEKSRRTRSLAAALVALIFIFGAPNANADEETNATRIMGIVDASHAKRFGTLLVQDANGRVKPMDTLAREALSKMARKSSIGDLGATQIFLGMLSAPRGWQQVKMIRLGHPDLGAMLGLENGAKEASFMDFFALDQDGDFSYKLREVSDIADRTPDSQKTLLQKELIKVYQRVDVAYMIYQGYLMRAIPVKGDPAFSWISPPQTLDLSPADAKETAQTARDYVEALRNAQTSGEWDKADVALDRLKTYQETYGAAVIPSAARVQAELLLNAIDPFFVLLFCYLAIGLFALVWAFTRALSPNFAKDKATYISAALIGCATLAFVFHAAALGLRWYVSGHAPWSNGFESVVYVAWAAALAGLFFAKRSIFALPAATLLSSFALMTAYLSSMDPQITTLAPVLKSHWLTIHVSVISASYGFLGVSMLLGLIALALFIFRAPKKIKIDETIVELRRINEMSMMVGLATLTIGNIFGAIWANESWGRYWSWDPKETWTLISMLIYAAILHFRFIPALRSAFVFSVASAWAFFSILMTYFGVNYYLSGMHSYASGEPAPIDDWLYIAIVAFVFLSVFASVKSDGRYPLESR
ncbi:MAG: cytochrome c biogenesis protein CcsA [Helicobacteraceae bacterium]|jgi:cytochrome c-type biogenesis protein CcsB|nr:cytochrome c biogenesis protein CcsA [Helicobacteraceae bacterium]